MKDYIIKYQQRPEASVRLFCFPFAGGSAANFRLWNAELPDFIELCAVELPGRLSTREATPQTMEELIDRLLPSIENKLDKPYVLFGHSFGSIVAFALLMKLQQKAKLLPKHLIVSSRRAPHLRMRGEPTYGLEEAEFIRVLNEQYQAIPQAILQEKELLQLCIPILRSDMRINEVYQAKPTDKIQVPLTVCYGEDDHTVKLERMQAWSELATASFEIRGFPGGHFYLDQSRALLLNYIANICKS